MVIALLKSAQIDDYLRNVRLEDIPTESQWLAEEFGLDTLLQLSRLSGGTNLYIPKLEGICVPAKCRMILAEFNGANIKELARRHHLTERRVQYILKDMRNK